ncbi:hypothetical protein SCACP_28550 [Sporomusa carbonis]|uniref:NusG domain II-containing protein n=1 Tax=Sporomusa carbonis TaxID=3076075 RepID=UPI003A6594A2
MRLILTKADKWLIGLLLFLSVTGIGFSVYAFPAGSGQSAEIWVDGALFKTVPLKEGYRQEIRIGGEMRYDIIQVEGARIRVREADCPEQICVLTGWINKAPQQIVCLPYRIVIKVVSTAPSEIDAIVR